MGKKSKNSLNDNLKFLKWYFKTKILFATIVWSVIIYIVYKIIFEPINDIQIAQNNFNKDKFEQQVILDKFIKVRNIEDAFDKKIKGVFVPNNKELKYSVAGKNQIKDSLGRIQTSNNCYDNKIPSAVINNLTNELQNDKLELYFPTENPNFTNNINFFGYKISNFYIERDDCPSYLNQKIIKIESGKVIVGSYKYPKAQISELLTKNKTLKNIYAIFDTSYNNDTDNSFIYYNNENASIVDTTNGGVSIYSKAYIDAIFNYAVEYWGTPAEAASYKNTLYYDSNTSLTKEERSKAKYFYEKWIFEKNNLKI